MSIKLACIEETAVALNRRAAIYLPDDAKAALRDVAHRETNQISRLSVRMALENIAIAEARA